MAGVKAVLLTDQTQLRKGSISGPHRVPCFTHRVGSGSRTSTDCISTNYTEQCRASFIPHKIHSQKFGQKNINVGNNDFCETRTRICSESVEARNFFYRLRLRLKKKTTDSNRFRLRSSVSTNTNALSHHHRRPLPTTTTTPRNDTRGGGVSQAMEHIQFAGRLTTRDTHQRTAKHNRGSVVGRWVSVCRT